MLFRTILISSSIFSATALALKCPEGHFESSQGKCQRCSPCLDDQVIDKSCSANTDTKCRCKPGFYLHNIRHTCMECKVIKPGEVYDSICGEFNDAVISACPKDYFAENSTMCLACTKCKPKQNMVSNCSKISDRICKDVPSEGVKTFILKITLGILPCIFVALIVTWCIWKYKYKCCNRGSSISRSSTTAGYQNEPCRISSV